MSIITKPHKLLRHRFFYSMRTVIYGFDQINIRMFLSLHCFKWQCCSSAYFKLFLLPSLLCFNWFFNSYCWKINIYYALCIVFTLSSICEILNCETICYLCLYKEMQKPLLCDFKEEFIGNSQKQLYFYSFLVKESLMATRLSKHISSIVKVLKLNKSTSCIYKSDMNAAKTSLTG